MQVFWQGAYPAPGYAAQPGWRDAMVIAPADWISR